ncbi:acyltransferase [soil metagenome]
MSRSVIDPSSDAGPPPTAASSALGVYEPALDGMRGICIAAVVVYHACAVAHLAGWMRGGFMGVSVFFTLSGFLITSLLLRELSGSGTIGLTSFWARRIRRLWPASLIVVLAVVVLGATDELSVHSSDAVAATWSVTNWHVILGGQQRLLQTIVGPLGPTWSLAVEEQFYLLLALLIVAVARLTRPQVALSLVASVCIVVPIALSNLLTDWHPSLEFNTVFRMPELFVGVLLATWQRPILGYLRGAKRGDVAAGIGLVLLLVLFLFVDYSPPWLLRGGYTLVAAISAMTIVGLLQHGRVCALISWAPLRSLGVVSYSLYLVHWPVISLLTPARVGRAGVMYAAIVVVASLAAAVLLHRLVERPVRRLRAEAVPTIVAGVAAAVALTALAMATL